MLSEAPFRSYPLLTPEEFHEVCHHLDRRYCHATLGPARRRWKLRVCTALNTAAFTLGPEYSTYLQIVRPLDGELDDGDLSAYLDNFSFGDGYGGGGREVEMEVEGEGEGGGERDREMMEAEEADRVCTLISCHEVICPVKKKIPTDKQTKAVLSPPPPPPPMKHNPSAPGHGHVRYEIHLHPTYQAPCLWFSLHDLPADEQEQALHVDTVFRRLVPDQYKEGLRSSMGGIGGISVDHHPITGVPSFFIHPCLLGEAMQRFECSKENYLMLWLGLVGGCVGLWVPAEMALES